MALAPWSMLRHDRIMNQSSAMPTVLSADEVASLPSKPLGHAAGVDNQVLWTDGTSITGILRIAGGAQLGRHTHRTHLHHMWILDGEAVILDRRLGPAAYVQVPPGIEHDIDATATAGVTVYYSYTLPTV
jgi:quercetin dioxygenase-like cupin family protein